MIFHLLTTALWLWTLTVCRDVTESFPDKRCSNATFQVPNITGLSTLSILAAPIVGEQLPDLSNICYCRVQINVTHDYADDNVLVRIDLPMASIWKGRFQAQGGGEFATGEFQHGNAVRDGWAVGSTDGGHQWQNIHDASWALQENGEIEWNLLENFAYRSLAELIIIGKEITEQYYETKPHHSYWNGCSTGGRQGYAIAQRYPGLVDGILANAPALSFTHLITAGFWPQLMMQTRNIFMSNCELDFVRNRSIELCDPLDGVRDRILEDPERCNFEPSSLVGEEITNCSTKSTIWFTQEMASLVSEIHRGPAWVSASNVTTGFAYGVNMNVMTDINVDEETGNRSIKPYDATASWMKYLVLRNPNANLADLDVSRYAALFGEATYQYSGLLNTDNPDLSALRDSGTKLMTWHGLDDEVIPVKNTIEYRKRAEQIMGGADKLDQYYRLFLAPGVEHCGGGCGAAPHQALEDLVHWVENGLSPQILPAYGSLECQGLSVMRNLCLWPARQVYVRGDPSQPWSWKCAGSMRDSYATVRHDGIYLAQSLMAELMASSIMLS